MARQGRSYSCRIADVLRPGGRFVMREVIVAADPAAAVTPLSPDHDRPSQKAGLAAWLATWRKLLHDTLHEPIEQRHGERGVTVGGAVDHAFGNERTSTRRR
jgi:hypothetical protein